MTRPPVSCCRCFSTRTSRVGPRSPSSRPPPSSCMRWSAPPAPAWTCRVCSTGPAGYRPLRRSPEGWQLWPPPRGATPRLCSPAGQAVALLDDEACEPLDRCTAYVVCAAAYNSLNLWELVDELFELAQDLAPRCPVPAQAAAIAVNRVLLRLERATSLLETGEQAAADHQLDRALEAVAQARACRCRRCGSATSRPVTPPCGCWSLPVQARRRELTQDGYSLRSQASSGPGPDGFPPGRRPGRC